MKTQTLEYSKAASRLTCTNIFFTSLLYSMKVEARNDLPSAAATDGVNLYYHPERFAKEFTASERVFVLVHELLHVILFHNTRRGIRDPQRWNIACDHVANLLCVEYGFSKPNNCYCDVQYKGMSAEQVYNKLPEDIQEQKGGMNGDVMDYDPSQNAGKSTGDVEREVAINTEQAAQAAKAAGKDQAGLKRIIGDAQVSREPWYQHLRRYMTSMHTRQYNWSRIDSRRAVLHGVIAPQQKAENMGKIVFGVDCSGSITARQLGAMSAHISDLLKDITPSSIVVVYFDSKICHVDEFTGPDYHVILEPYGGGGTEFKPVFGYVSEEQSDAQLVVMFTDLFGSFPDEFGVCNTLWVSQTERVEVPFGELIYGELNEG